MDPEIFEWGGGGRVGSEDHFTASQCVLTLHYYITLKLHFMHPKWWRGRVRNGLKIFFNYERKVDNVEADVTCALLTFLSISNHLTAIWKGDFSTPWFGALVGLEGSAIGPFGSLPMGSCCFPINSYGLSLTVLELFGWFRKRFCLSPSARPIQMRCQFPL